MNARQEILGAVRRALGAAHGQQVPVPRGYRDRPATPPTGLPAASAASAAVTGPGDGVVDLFVERVEDYRATVSRCDGHDVEDLIAAALGSTRRVVVPEGFPYDVAGAVPDDRLTATDLDTTDGVVTTAAVGIAVTGTIVLDHGAGQGRRALSLVPDLHVCLVRASQIVHGVPEAVALLDPGRPQTWISGPSATSDIELDRVEGVHGPRRLHVVVLEDA